jgi:hypothetical protein
MIASADYIEASARHYISFWCAPFLGAEHDIEAELVDISYSLIAAPPVARLSIFDMPTDALSVKICHASGPFPEWRSLGQNSLYRLK